MSHIPEKSSTTTPEIILLRIMQRDRRVLRRRDREADRESIPPTKREAINKARRLRRAILKSNPAIVPPIAKHRRAGHG